MDLEPTLRARHPPPWAERFGWGWLAGFTLIAVIGIVALQRWVERDARALESLARETEILNFEL